MGNESEIVVLSRSSLSNPSCTILISPGAYSHTSARASWAEPRNQVSNSSLRVNGTGMRS